jgi:hypothetical protein
LASIGDTHTDTDWWEEFMKYAVEMGSGAVIYIPSFTMIGSGVDGVGVGRFRDGMNVA